MPHATGSLVPRDTATSPGSQWNASLEERAAGRARAYAPNLTPQFSVLRPHCAAKLRLTVWRPEGPRKFLDSEGNPFVVTEDEAERLLNIISHSYADDTLVTYASGLLVYHVFCDSRGVPEAQRAPASPDLIAIFVATIAGSYSGSTITNYLAGIRAWHIIHGVKWQMDKNSLDAIVKGATKHAPETSKRKQRQPYTVEFISTLREGLDLAIPLDAAVYACLTTTFYGSARLGEFTVPSLNGFNPRKHITLANVAWDKEDRQGFKVTQFFVPQTKTSANGETVYWATQEGVTDPDAAIKNHIRVNSPAQTDHLFAYKHTDRGGKVSSRPLTKTAFLTRVRKAAMDRGLEPLQGHGIRIGGTLEYLLRGLSFETVKAKGRWAGDSFLRYLRKHALIMAPYMQAQLQQEFIAYTMPPAR